MTVIPREHERRMGRWLGPAAWAFGLFVLPLVALALIVLSPTGQAWMASQAAGWVSRSIQGTIRARSISLGVGSIRLGGVEVESPEGEIVLAAETIEVALDPATFRRKPWTIDEVQLRGAKLLLEWGEAGDLSLVRAFQPRQPGSDEPSTLSLIVERLAGEKIAVVARPKGGEAVFAADDLAFELRSSLDPAGGALAGTLRAQLLQPLREEASLEVDATLRGGFRALELAALRLQVGGSSLALEGTGDLESAQAELGEIALTLHPDELAALVPGSRLGASVQVMGRASLENGSLRSNLRLSQGDGEIEGSGELEIWSRSWKLSAAIRSLGLATLDLELPGLILDADLEASGSGLASIDAEVRGLRATAGATKLGPVAMRGSLQDGRIAVDHLDAVLPGGRLGASGWVEDDRTSLRFDLHASSLQRLFASTTRFAAAAGFASPAIDDLAGALHAEGRIEGRLASPSIRATLRSDRITWGDGDFVSIDAAGSVAGLDSKATATFVGTIEEIVTPGTTLRGIRADLDLSKGRAKGKVVGESPFGGIHASLDAAVAAGFEWLRFDALELGWPGASWSLREPARTTLSPQLVIETMTLDGDEGSELVVSGRGRSGGAFDLEARAARIDLARLPPELVSKEVDLRGILAFDLRLARDDLTLEARVSEVDVEGLGRLAPVSASEGLRGKVDAELRLQGKLSSPTGTLLVRGHDLGGAGLEAVDLRALATFPGPITLDAISGPSTLHAEVDGLIDLGALLRDADRELERALSAPLIGRLDLDAFELRRLAGRFGLPADLEGEAALGLGLTGSIRRPRLQAETKLRALRLAGLTPIDATFAAEATDEALQARLTSTLGDRPFLDGEARLGGPIEALSEWKELSLFVDIRGERIRLSSIGGLWRSGGAATRTRRMGRAAVDLRIDGSFAAPVVSLDLHAVGVGRGLLQASEQALDEAGSSSAQRGVVDATDRSRASGGGGRGAPVDRGASGAGLVERDGAGEGLAVRRVDPDSAAGAFGRGATAGRGRLPEGDAGRREPRTGDVELKATYRNKRLSASAALTGAAGGGATLVAAWDLDLGVDAWAESLAGLARAPLDVSLESHGLDIGFVQVFSQDLRQVEGRLDAALQLRGEPAAPELDGFVALRQGRLSYTGMGDLRDIELELEVRGDRASLRRLELRSSGTLRASGEATRAGPGQPFHLDFDLVARRFGVVSNDLTRVYLDADARLEAELSRQALDGTLSILAATIELPNTPKKSVQELEAHPDFHVGSDPEPSDTVLVSAKGGAQGAHSPFELSLRIVNRKPIHVTGVDLAGDGNVDLRLGYGGEGPSLAGTIDATKGYVVVMSRRFELERGRVYYLGKEALADPRLDVVAIHESPHAKVTVTVGGTAQKFTADLRSTPAMSEAEIATLLATGKPQLKRGAGGVSEVSGAATALGAVVTSQLKRGIAAKLPVDVISFQAGEEGLDAGSLEAGSYVTDRIYVGYARNFGVVLETDRRNTNEVRVEYELLRRWTLEVTYGDRGAGGADLFWTRDW